MIIPRFVLEDDFHVRIAPHLQRRGAGMLIVEIDGARRRERRRYADACSSCGSDDRARTSFARRAGRPAGGAAWTAARASAVATAGGAAAGAGASSARGGGD